jgi:serine/threonine protein kinase
LGKTFHIPDYELVIEVARGSYGQVWLARSVLGTWRAIKIVQKDLFDDARPYQREFNGIRQYESVSRGHPGLIDVLHVGCNEGEGYFYYVMELGDDQVVGQSFGSADYSPRTLQSELNTRGSLPADECAYIGAQLADALHYLHEKGLVHRDIKPSNIVYVNGCPKLADMGLVAGAGFTSSTVGTLGFLPQEGSGDWRGDLYALGKVLYEASTGMDRNEFPDLPSHARNNSSDSPFMRLNQVCLRACSLDERDGYPGAAQLTAELNQINAPSIFSGPFSWREKRLLAVIATLVFLLLVSDAVLIYLGLRSEPSKPVLQASEDDNFIKGKYEVKKDTESR